MTFFNSVKNLQIIPFFKVDRYFTMLDPSVKFDEIDAFLQKLSMGNQKCDNADEEDSDMIPMCRPCFAGNTKGMKTLIIILHNVSTLKVV